MGCFSWEFCDCKGRLIIGKPAYLLMPDGEHIYECSYGGYGGFGGYDVHELMATKNLDYLKSVQDYENYVEPVDERNQYGSDESYERAVSRYQWMVERLKDFASGKDKGYMCERYGRDWLRCIGIYLDFCPDEYKNLLPFRIKVSSKPVPYDSVPPSEDDELQGCF